MQKSNSELFTTMPVGKAVAKLAVPTVISQIVVILYSLADTFFVGQDSCYRETCPESESRCFFSGSFIIFPQASCDYTVCTDAEQVGDGGKKCENRKCNG